MARAVHQVAFVSNGDDRPSGLRLPSAPLIPHTAPLDRVPPASHLRGTVLVASLRGLQRRGYDARYKELLERDHHDSIAALTAMSWVPMPVGLAHYRACDALGLSRHEIDEMGMESGRFLNETMLASVAKLARESGLTPWIALSHVPKLMTRTFVGSSLAVWKLGPKEAQLEWEQNPLAAVPYFRSGWAAFTKGMLRLFTRTLYVRELPPPSRERICSHMAIRVSWV